MSRIEHLADGVTLYLGDCREIDPALFAAADTVISDPPYGMRRNGRYQRGQCSSSVQPYAAKTPQFGIKIEGDNEPFDPMPWLEFPCVVLWGCNHFGARLPVGTTLVWLKRLDTGFGSFLSDAELAFEKSGCGVYCKRDLSLQGHHEGPTIRPRSLSA